MTFTPGQARCINTLDKPLIISAGAGSGKTFTLTQRIVGAIKSGYVDDIGQILAITYTNKAAREIKTRVVRELRANGMTEQALKAEDAWISTIHGMCSRILRAHALELSIDPEFEILSGSVEKEIRAIALQKALKEIDEIISEKEKQALLAEYNLTSAGFSGASIEGYVEKLMSLSDHLVGGGDFIAPGKAIERRDALATLVKLAKEWQSLIAPLKDNPSKIKAENALADAIANAEALMSSVNLDELTEAEYLDAVDMFPTKDGGRIGDSEYKSARAAVAQDMKDVILEVAYAHSQSLIDPLVKLAQQATEYAKALKHELGYLSNGDLLTKTYKAMDEHPEIANDYQNRFKLVMVDEFQDTNQMQVDMIARLAGKQGERLCVVGDSQQSIYRFQGADVSVYKRHLKKLKSNDPQSVIELPDNFRSHHDVLAFVDRIFEKPEAFGNEFMSLTASRDESRCDKSFAELSQRVEIQLATKPSASNGAKAEPAYKESARTLAKRFAELAEQGFRQKDMAILMGSTTHADEFAAALRDEGLSCIIAKGSVFNRADEVTAMTDLAKAITNPMDTQMLFKVLSGPMFCLSTDDYMQLVQPKTLEDGRVVRTRLNDGLTDVYFQCREDEGAASPALENAAMTLCPAIWHVGRKPLSQIVSEAISSSGMLLRLQGEGAEATAIAANVLKALRILEDLESNDCLGPSALAQLFSDEVDEAKEAPGTLVTENDDAVRIMTIHSSKGLEFPICAVCMFNAPAKKQSLIGYEHDGNMYLSLAPGKCKDNRATIKESLKTEAVDPLEFADEDELIAKLMKGGTAGAIAYDMDQVVRSADNQEKLRLFYVGITRAKEMLILVAENNATREFPGGKVEFINKLVSNALVGYDAPFAESEAAYDFRGYQPAAFTHRYSKLLEEEGSEPASANPESFAIFERTDAIRNPYVRPNDSRDGLFSYSAIAHAAESAEGLGEIAGYVEDPFAETDGKRFLSTDVLDDFISVNDDEYEGSSTFIKKSRADSDKATSMGTAFHRLAQMSAIMWRQTKRIAQPPRERVETISKQLGINDSQHTRLDAALKRWCNSAIARKAEKFDLLRPEVTFTVPVVEKDTGRQWAMEGEIDLLCTMDSINDAFVIDYKTGGHPGESIDELREKHLLQGACYAYALLKQGYESVTACFVRVEVPDENGQPQNVAFTFEEQDVQELEQVIANAYKSTLA